MDLDAIPPLDEDGVDRIRARATFLCSHPKCGRTWVRFMLASCINRALDLRVDLDLRTVFRIVPNDARNVARFQAMGKKRKADVFAFAERPEVPVVLATHAKCSPALLRRPVVLLVRSIADTLASHHAQRVERGRDVPPTLGGYLRLEPSPLDALIDYYNDWADGLGRARPTSHPSLIVSYEQFRADPGATLRRVADFVGVPAGDDVVQLAVRDGGLDAMRALEDARGAEWRDDPAQSLTRVRAGRVGGAGERLSDAEHAQLRERCEQRLSEGAKRLFNTAGAG